ncbi:MAG: hypothetical protein ACRDN9_06230 [Streptosporangiaceae bacterium]
MSQSQPDTLDELLAAWAQRRRLPDADAEDIRRAIIHEAPALPATWWIDFNRQMAATVVRATTPAPALAALRRTSRPVAVTT